MEKNLENPVLKTNETFPRAWLLSVYNDLKLAVECDKLYRPDLSAFHFAAASVLCRQLSKHMGGD